MFVNNFIILYNHTNESKMTDDEFDKHGIHKVTGTKFNEAGYDRLGYDVVGFNKNGFDKNGFDKSGNHKATGTKIGRAHV